MGEFWETIMGSHFYQQQLPALIESVNRLAKANKELNETIQEQNRLLKMDIKKRDISHKLD